MPRTSMAILLTSVGAASAAMRTSEPAPGSLLHEDASAAVSASIATTAALRSGLRASPLDGNPNPWSSLIDAKDFHEGFEFEGYVPHGSLSSVADFRPLAGQTNPDGVAWGSATGQWNGILDNSTAQTGVSADGMGGFGPPGSGYSGAVGGPDPGGARGRFMSSPRDSVWDFVSSPLQNSPFYVARFEHTQYEPLADAPVVTVVDLYMDALDTRIWLRPVSPRQNSVVANVFMGGIDFATFASDGLTDEAGQLHRPVLLNVNTLGEFTPFIHPEHLLKTREWFSVAIRQAPDSFSLWIRDSETVGVYGFTDDSSGLFDGDMVNVTGDGQAPFEGEIFESGWLQLYPGLDDDPSTTLIEGLGRTTTSWGAPVAVFIDASGSPAGPRPSIATGVGALTMVGGDDPHPFVMPDYRASDWYFDNYTVMGEPWCAGDLFESAPRTIDGADLASLLAEWGETVSSADLNNDSIVDGEDLALLLSRWGNVCTTANQWATP